MVHPAEKMETAIRMVGTPDPGDQIRILENHELRAIVEQTANDPVFREALEAVAKVTGEVPWPLAAYRYALKHNRIVNMQMAEHLKGKKLHNDKLVGKLDVSRIERVSK